MIVVKHLKYHYGQMTWTRIRLCPTPRSRNFNFLKSFLDGSDVQIVINITELQNSIRMINI